MKKQTSPSPASPTQTIDDLAAIAREKKDAFLQGRADKAEIETLRKLADEYSVAIAAWHKARFPGKKFSKPTFGYLMRVF